MTVSHSAGRRARMIYMLKGQQYLVVATGCANLPAELIALGLTSHRRNTGR